MVVGRVTMIKQEAWTPLSAHDTMGATASLNLPHSALRPAALP